MPMPDAAALLDAWDGGNLRPVPDRGSWLVERLGLAPEGLDADDLSVGQCDLLLVGLRTELFGPVIDAVYVCPGCGSDNECRIEIAALWPELAAAGRRGAAANEVDLDLRGRRFHCRLPSNRDLAEVARFPPSRRAARLVELCVIVGPGDTAAHVGDDLAHDLIEALAEKDSGACTPIEFRCGCGSAHLQEFDIRSFLWTELASWAERIVTEVHQLASVYGWRESEILGLPARRRRAYLELCGW